MQRAFALAVSALMLVPLTASWRQPDVPWPVHALVAVILGLTAFRPRWGVLILAGLFPMVPAIQALFPVPLSERMLLAFLVPAGLHLSASRDAPGSPLAAPGSLLVAVLLASGLLPLAVLAWQAASTTAFVTALWDEVSRSYFLDAGTFQPLHDTWTWIEAIAAAVFFELLLRREPGLERPALRLLLLGAGGLAFFSLNRVIELALRDPPALETVIRMVRRARFNPFYPDVNAAASLYALLAVPAIWLAWKGTSRYVTAPAGLLLSLAVWFAGSRAALASVALVTSLLGVVATRPSRRTLAIAAGALLAGLVLFAAVSRRNAPASVAISIRADLTRVAFDLTARAPVFGVGLNAFRTAARGTMSEEMKARNRGFLREGENAHNNFLQVLAELGILGLGAFLWFVAPALRGLLHRDRSSVEALALSGGVLAFLLTCLLGHPLLIDHVRALFFLVVGMAVAASAATRPPARQRRWAGALTLLMILAVIASWPARVGHAQRQAHLDGTVIGASARMDVDSGGVVYRIAEARSTWFIAGNAHAVEIPLRLRTGTAGSCLVHVALDGRPANTVRPTDESWSPLFLQLPPSNRQSRRLDLDVAPADCTLMVGSLKTR